MECDVPCNRLVHTKPGPLKEKVDACLDAVMKDPESKLGKMLDQENTGYDLTVTFLGPIEMTPPPTPPPKGKF